MSERLTKRINGVVVYVGTNNPYTTGQIPCEVEPAGVREMMERLAEFEDTTLSPQDFMEYKKFEDGLIASGKISGHLIELLNAYRGDGNQ